MFTKDEKAIIISALDAAITVAIRNQKGKAPTLAAAFQAHERVLQALKDKVADAK